MKSLFDKTSFKTSKLTTETYSTSFSLGTRFLGSEIRDAIYGIYGFVRFADEIVDTFHDYDMQRLLNKFKADTYEAIEDGISLNPILNSFQYVVREYSIDFELIDTFLESMEMDLNKSQYSQQGYEKYILGSAEVVGLMCLKVFVHGNETEYKRLQYSAMRLGAAFQKINFLRDLKADFEGMGRSYFPNADLDNFNDQQKKEIEKEIQIDFAEGYAGILELPKSSRFGVYMAYIYFFQLFKKIQRTQASRILEERIRIPNPQKYTIFLGSYVRHSFNLL
ncbi:phytoene/squalene synthase family protein [bacterium]|jgi:15-cis-phytoene synthase|nr:phytoene/squalene synthase family protein [bacterium]MDC1221660.1 phytoene/squalene synthase family protein [Salibacteraceae bacterium]